MVWLSSIRRIERVVDHWRLSTDALPGHCRQSPGLTALPVPRSHGAYSMTATTSPGPTESPAGHPDLLDRPRLLGLTTLFSIFMASSTQTVWPTSTVVAHGDQHLDDGALHGHGHGARAGRRRRPPWAAWARRPGRTAPADGHASPRSGTHSFTWYRRPSTSAVTSRSTLGRRLVRLRRSPAGLGRRLGGQPSSGRASARPSWSSASPAAKSGWERMATSAGRVVATPVDHRLLDGPEHPPPGRLPVVAPDHQLGHQVVVELADGVARPVAGVEPDAGAAGSDELG